MPTSSPPRSRARRLPVLLVAVLASVVLVAGGSIAADLVGVPLRPPVSDRIRAQVDVERATIPELQAALEGGRVRSVDLVGLYLERIAAVDEDGPSLNAVIALDPGAYDTARALDTERRRTGPRGPLHGIPILLKDNIDTANLPTTAGSVVLAGSTPPDDATIARQLRDAGAIVLGKTNLTEFANFMTNGMPGGYSSWGGQSLNPYGAEDSPSGSSAGSGVAAAAGLAAATVGTETSGSILSPARANSLVGLKPTLGLVSRDGIVPIAESQDTAGPMTRSVVDAAVLLGAMTGVDPADPRTQESAGNAETDYQQFLTGDSLEGARIGLAANAFAGLNSRVAAILDQAITVLEDEGAVIVEGVDVTAQRARHPRVRVQAGPQRLPWRPGGRPGPVPGGAHRRQRGRVGRGAALRADAPGGIRGDRPGGRRRRVPGGPGGGEGGDAGRDRRGAGGERPGRPAVPAAVGGGYRRPCRVPVTGRPGRLRRR